MAAVIGAIIAAVTTLLSAYLVYSTNKKQAEISESTTSFDHMTKELARHVARNVELEEMNTILYRDLVAMRAWAIGLVKVLQDNDIQVDLPPELF